MHFSALQLSCLITYGCKALEGTLKKLCLVLVITLADTLIKFAGITAPDALIKDSKYAKFAFISEALMVPPELKVYGGAAIAALTAARAVIIEKMKVLKKLFIKDSF